MQFLRQAFFRGRAKPGRAYAPRLDLQCAPCIRSLDVSAATHAYFTREHAYLRETRSVSRALSRGPRLLREPPNAPDVYEQYTGGNFIREVSAKS